MLIILYICITININTYIMKALQEKLTSEIDSKLELIKELKKIGNEKRAFALFEEVQGLKARISNIVAFRKIK